MTRPIRPSDVSKVKKSSIPDEVFQAFNELIAEKMRGKSAVVMQNEVIERILKKMEPKECTRAQIFDNGWLDVEADYSRSGWSVDYDKPGYNEMYEAKFTFTARSLDRG